MKLWVMHSTLSPVHVAPVKIMCWAKQILQVLEGDPADVTTLFSTICQDSRHSQVKLQLVAQVYERHFVKWKMKEVAIERLSKADFGWVRDLLIHKDKEYFLPQENLTAYTLLRTIYEVTSDT